MAIVVEYRPGLDFGVGVDSLNGGIRGDAVLRTPVEEATGTSGQMVLLTLKEVESQEDLESKLGISTDEMSASWRLLSGESKFSLAEQCKFHQYSLYLVVHVEVMNSFRQMCDVHLRDEALDLLRNGHADRFRERFGDLFVQGEQTGGELSAILEIRCTDKSDLEAVKAQFKAIETALGE